ncbi:MAG: biosynthetic-type acetolactate synthase large subunit [Lachnospiraceae bacterium]|nr:biosynthetic-type acetolactate synthase large subunit [Lachnospiraceae bacterium]MDY5742307.1 biosynthetic-type acetolactate synthase large subunit [Lachnospiraceae bacterium]
MKLSGSAILLECLKEQGVDTIFGYPGGAILNVYDELYRQQDHFKHILTAHEQGASHAADGYARATGRVGVCFATSGPGATNLVTGLATAMMDSIPVVAITCNVGLPLIGRDSFQEVDISGITMPITKHNFMVRDVACLADTLRRAFRIAMEGRRGPVLVDIPKNVTGALCEFERKEKEEIHRRTDKMREEDIEKVVAMLQDTRKPFLLIGGGAVGAEAAEEVRTFMELMNCPVTDTLMGRGVVPNDHPNNAGMIGMHGTKAANIGLSAADLVVSVGARFDDRVTGDTAKFCTNAKIIHLDVDSAEIDKNIITDAHIIGDLKVVLQEINRRLPQQNHQDWLDKINDMKETYPLRIDRGRLTAPAIIEVINELVDVDNTLIVTEVGQHQMWAAQHYNFRHPRTLLTSGGLGTMGYGLGAAIGAKYAMPHKTVINIAGDGCFRMNLNELTTVARYRVPIIQMIFNNTVLGMVRQWQTLFYECNYSQTTFTDDIDFVKISEALNVKAVRVTTLEELRVALGAALQEQVPVVLDCRLDKDDSVFPMVPAGSGLDGVFDETDLG